MLVGRRSRATRLFSFLLLSISTLGWASALGSASSAQTQQSSGVAPKTSAEDATSEQQTRPIRSIDLAPLDFRRLSPLRSRDGASHFTVSFFDEDRVLISFESAGVVRRLPGCAKTHDDRVV